MSSRGATGHWHNLLTLRLVTAVFPSVTGDLEILSLKTHRWFKFEP